MPQPKAGVPQETPVSWGGKPGDKLRVTAHPRAKCPRVVAGMDGTFNVYVVEPPENGRANRAIQKALADYLDMAPSLLTLVSGESFKQKIFIVIR